MESMDDDRNILFRALSFYQNIPTTATSDLRSRYHQLLQQVFSFDSILQLVALDSIPLLNAYAEGQPPGPRLSPLVPALGMIFVNLYSGTECQEVIVGIEAVLRPLCCLLAKRAQTVYHNLISRRTIVVDPATSSMLSYDATNVEETGCYYGKPPHRIRPHYEGRDVDNEHSITDDGTCRKFYSTYKKNNLSGGLMALWCPHLTCVGFHMIPSCEGRNDVFSALFCYWKEAPKVVIYDFACQLGPYCMLREPEFFRNTLFVVDEMHAGTHKQCSQASFIANYMQVRPSMMAINSSAAECSNSGLNRIRKSVSYMGPSHAALFTYVYLSVWNRKKQIRLMEAATKRMATASQN
jgi:hypothetical protein